MPNHSVSDVIHEGGEAPARDQQGRRPSGNLCSGAREAGHLAARAPLQQRRAGATGRGRPRARAPAYPGAGRARASCVCAPRGHERAQRATARARLGVAGDVGEDVSHEVARQGVGAGGQPLAPLGVKAARAVGEQTVQPRDGAGGGQPPGGARARVPRRRVQAAGHQHESPGAQAVGGDRVQQDLRARVVAANQGPRPEHIGGEAEITSANQSSVYGWPGRSSESPWRGRSGSTTRKRSAELLPCCGRASWSAAARAAGRRRARGRRRGRRRGGGRDAASYSQS